MVNCAHLCSSGPHFVLSLPAPPDAPAHPLGTIGPFSAPVAGFALLSLVWKTSQYCFPFCAEMNCVTCWTFICSCCWWGAELLMCPGLLVPQTAFFFCMFSPFQCPLVAPLSSTFEHQQQNSHTLTPPTKQVQRSSNSQLWCNSRDCSLLYPLKII